MSASLSVEKILSIIWYMPDSASWEASRESTSVGMNRQRSLVALRCLDVYSVQGDSAAKSPNKELLLPSLEECSKGNIFKGEDLQRGHLKIGFHCGSSYGMSVLLVLLLRHVYRGTARHDRNYAIWSWQG